MASDRKSLLESTYEKEVDILFYGKENNSESTHKLSRYCNLKI